MGEYRNARSNVHHCLIQDRPAAAGTTDDTTELKLDASMIVGPNYFDIPDFDSGGGTRGGGTGKYKNVDGDVPMSILKRKQKSTQSIPNFSLNQIQTGATQSDCTNFRLLSKNCRGLTTDDRLE